MWTILAMPCLASRRCIDMTREQAKRKLLEWTRSGGFAATHKAKPRATDEAIVEDLLQWFERNGLAIQKVEK